jgi:hypothetical protein
MAETVSIKIGDPTTRYDAVGRCIYCGATRYSGAEIRPLSDEHIIAEGLSGTLVLPRASCRSCAKVTGKIEGNVLRTILWAPRTLMNLRTKRPRERPTKFTAMATVSGKDVNIDLPIEDYPTMLFFPGLGPPGILVGRARELGDMRQMWTYNMNLNLKTFAKYGIQSMASAVMDTHRFSQMLAKISHSFAVARLGLEGFTPLLLDHILGAGESPWHFVGGGNDDPPPSLALHEIGHQECDTNGKRYLMVRVRLFAGLGAPDYLVVTGELPSKIAA